MVIRTLLVDKLSHATFLLGFIFCGVIVGENLSLSLVVSTFGSSILSRMYLVNGVLLYGLPILFFGYIDRVDRGRLLSQLLLFCSFTLLVLLFVILLVKNLATGKITYLLTVLYPFSYLSKTILFLTFWTFANDIFPTEMAKKKFPAIAAWGIIGGIFGSCIATISIKVVSAEMLIALWSMSFIAAWFFLKKIRIRHEKELKVHEELREKILFKKKHQGAQQSPSVLLLLLMSFQYFLVFLSVFSLDYLFWSKCHIWFGTSESIVSFQFTFYLVHASVTVIGLRLFLPRAIDGIGFTRIFYSLPGVLFAGSVFIISFMLLKPGESLFLLFTVVQLVRYVIFENAYSPIYQMYFAAIEKEKRGRAKMLIEGFVKPGTIIISGIMLLFLEKNEYLILMLIACCGGIGIINAIFIRKTYARALIPRALTILEPQTIINEFTGNSDREFMSLVALYSNSAESDMRIIAVRLLAVSGSQKAFDELKRLYETDPEQKVKEAVARSLSGFYNYTTRLFFDELMNDSNQRIKANALYSLNKMHCNWKRYLVPVIRKFHDEPNGIRVLIEASCYLWDNGDLHDRQNADKFVKSLLYNTNQNRQSAGVYLSGILKQPHWELELINKVHSPHVQVFKKALETIFRIDSEQMHIKVLRILEEKSTEQLFIAGKVIEQQGIQMWNTIVEFLPKAKNRRMVYELIRCIRLLFDEIRASGKVFLMPEKTKEEIVKWMNSELELVYKEICLWYNCKENIREYVDTAVMDEAMRENVTGFCDWAVNVMVLLDKGGVLTWRYNDIDVRDHDQRIQLIEIMEGTSYDGAVSMVLPILKSDSWENITQYGKSYFKIEDQSSKVGLIYFLKSDNKWISLCTKYTLSKLSKNQWTPELVRVVQRMENDSDEQVIPASTEFLERKFYGPKKNYAVDLLERVLFLKATPLFKNVISEKLMKLAEIVQDVFYQSGEVISKQGDIAEFLYIVKSGRIRIMKNDGDHLVQVSMVNSSESYGEIGLFNQATRSATAIALDDSQLLVIKRSQLKRLLVEVPDIAFNLLEVLSDRLRKSGEEIIELTRKNRAEENDSIIKLIQES